MLAEWRKFMSRAVLGLQGCSVYGYATRKTFEIPACGAVLVSDIIPEYADLGFEPGANMLAVDRDDGDLRATIEAFLADRARLDEIAIAGYALVHARHTVARRAEQLAELLSTASRES